MNPNPNKKKIFYSNINYSQGSLSLYWDEIYNKSHAEGQFHINLARRFAKNRFVARSGNWTTPWQTELAPGFEIPNNYSTFSGSFSDVTNSRALDIKKLINTSESRVAVYYSGGIDSVVCLAALIQNLSTKELQKIDVCMSSESIIENPYFFENYISGKFNILDSAFVNYNDIEKRQDYAITCDQGDSIFGTELATEMYYKYDLSNRDVHFSRYQDMIIEFFQLNNHNQFGKLFYERLLENINTSEVQIFSLHDFFWWIIFNLKYMDCALRGPVFYYPGIENRKMAITKTIINWFHHNSYQYWSMANNNNGQKIRGNSAATYKWAARQYIYAFDKNDWYLRHKLKLSSLINLSHRNKNNLSGSTIFALDTKYDLMPLLDKKTEEFILQRMT
ncbi:MAG: hypothetical protein WA160_08330 [Pseudobdellovibrio sp.]